MVTTSPLATFPRHKVLAPLTSMCPDDSLTWIVCVVSWKMSSAEPVIENEQAPPTTLALRRTPPTLPAMSRVSGVRPILHPTASDLPNFRVMDDVPKSDVLVRMAAHALVAGVTLPLGPAGPALSAAGAVLFDA